MDGRRYRRRLRERPYQSPEAAISARADRILLEPATKDPMYHRFFSIASGIVVTVLVAFSAPAQTLNIWPGVAPGSEDWKQKETAVGDTPLGMVIINVVTPTITAY